VTTDLLKNRATVRSAEGMNSSGDGTSKKRRTGKARRLKKFDVIPNFLKGLKQWVVYTAVQKIDSRGRPIFKTVNGTLTDENTGIKKLEKRPYDPKLLMGEEFDKYSGFAKTNDPATWSKYEAAVTVVRQHKEIYGIGFVFAKSDNLVAIDLDNCVDPISRAIISAKAAKIVKKFDGAYIEYSPSKNGLHIIVQGQAVETVTRDWIEIYGCRLDGTHSHRFFTMTGDVHQVGQIANFQDALIWLHFEYIHKEVPMKQLNDASNGAVSKDEVERRVMSLSVEHATDRQSWLRIGMILHNYGVSNKCPNAMLKLWLQFSKTCPTKYDERVCKSTWDSFGKHPVSNPLTIGSLMWLTRGDDTVTRIDSAQDKLPLFREMPKAKPFPATALGEILGQAAIRCAEATQASLTICCLDFLAAANYIAQGYCDVYIDGRTFPCSEFLILIAESGERKTAVDDCAQKEINRFENELCEAFEDDLERYKRELDSWKSEQRRIVSSRKATSKSVKAKQLERLGSEPAKPLQPYLKTSSPTWEGLYDSLKNGRPVQGIHQ
jgi:hypothetical protein